MFKTTIDENLTELQKKINESIIDIQKHHHKIIDDWCKAYLAQMYEEGHNLKPGDFVLNEMECKEYGVFGRKYWFTLKESEKD